jgi:hypothetical protein
MITRGHRHGRGLLPTIPSLLLACTASLSGVAHAADDAVALPVRRTGDAVLTSLEIVAAALGVLILIAGKPLTARPTSTRWG